jgi:hypothetical protein
VVLPHGEMVSSGPPATPWFLDYLHRSRLFSWLMRVCLSALEYLDIRSLRHTSERAAPPTSWLSKVTRDLASAALLAGRAYGNPGVHAVQRHRWDFGHPAGPQVHSLLAPAKYLDGSSSPFFRVGTLKY